MVNYVKEERVCPVTVMQRLLTVVKKASLDSGLSFIHREPAQPNATHRQQAATHTHTHTQAMGCVTVTVTVVCELCSLLHSHVNESPDQAGALHPNEKVNYFWNIKHAAALLHEQQTPAGMRAEGKYLEGS